MRGRAADVIASLPGARWLPLVVARIHASVHTKLLVAFTSIVLLLVALGAVGLGALQSANERALELVTLEKRIAAYRQLQHNTTGQLYSAASAFLAADVRELDTVERELQRFSYDFDRARFVAAEDAEFLRDMEADYTDLMQTGSAIIELIRRGSLEEAQELHQQQSVPLATALERRTLSLVNKAEAEMIDRAELSGSAYRTSQIAVVAASLATVLLALVLGYTISSSLIDPVQAIRARLRNIAQGDFHGQIEVANRDELGDLAENVNRMSRKLDRLYGELEAANRHKSAFLANMSHELRTPMNAIIGFNRLVMRRCKDILPERQYENLGKIAVSADHLLTLINTILDLSKIEAGRMEVRPTEFDPAPLLDMCARTVEPLVDGKDIELVRDIPPDLATVCTDQHKLRQIVLNLLSNAAKFTDRGSIVLAARAGHEAMTISVSDTGIGIEKDQLTSVFEEFTQLDSSASRRHPGTGLGLAISRHLAILLGGSIDVESRPGAGSTFTLTVPIRGGAPRNGDVAAEGHQAADEIRLAS